MLQYYFFIFLLTFIFPPFLNPANGPTSSAGYSRSNVLNNDATPGVPIP